jgi:23S rRNA pseudoU1915 N3-methylase RlmH
MNISVIELDNETPNKKSSSYLENIILEYMRKTNFPKKLEFQRLITTKEYYKSKIDIHERYLKESDSILTEIEDRVKKLNSAYRQKHYQLENVLQN